MKCPYCNNEAEFVSSKEFYGKDFGTNLYLCRPCKAYVGTHGKSKTPLGTMANVELRALRKTCHKEFDRLWRGKTKRMNRGSAYKWLADRMNLSKEEAHIGMFDKEKCLKLLKIMSGDTP